MLWDGRPPHGHTPPHVPPGRTAGSGLTQARLGSGAGVTSPSHHPDPGSLGQLCLPLAPSAQTFKTRGPSRRGCTPPPARHLPPSPKLLSLPGQNRPLAPQIKASSPEPCQAPLASARSYEPLTDGQTDGQVNGRTDPPHLTPPRVKAPVTVFSGRVLQPCVPNAPPPVCGSRKSPPHRGPSRASLSVHA